MDIGEEDAQAIALRALAYVAEDGERLARFLEISGIGQQDVSGRLSDPTFLAGVLDFVLSDDSMTVDFVNRIEIDPMLPRLARRKLPGAEPDG